ncbi:MAG: acyl carrier protein [Actinomycetota bacterium]|nr:acyl carrier protein [Actinomycetota bacterium]
MTDKQQEIFAVIKEHLEGRGIEADDITMEADLAGDIGLDSLDTVELTLALEQHYEIEIPDSELEELATVKDAVALIEKKVSVKT